MKGEDFMRSFRNKIGKFGSLVSLLLLTAMLALFATSFSVFWSSTAGQVFSIFWVAFVIVMCTAHTIRLSAREERPLPVIALRAGSKDARTRKSARMMRTVRG